MHRDIETYRLGMETYRNRDTEKEKQTDTETDRREDRLREF